mmetsp:Transcript_15536/g.29301  ORF Transcript_15536/g.29301 Transcript_15536/m.29301 type:complete len:512 (+) Transcript_15536:317-1852(+)|eukprot:CAMPEP_0176502272 /NCGR_PEP_ID=MMETSP0200_2-20121128/14656_1 /TAXON_ID=947934 /ORGANISM="Chaetoceros sp., Strain GSL56" /LENGTH=511 /DNA_ID=CAMNT_0017901315 /DNA_START=293 /DNA_END=1828 /DNA_ORIENTATION=+
MTINNKSQQTSSKEDTNFNPINVGEAAGTNGNNSDNSGFSLGNNSFGFNFDSEEGNPSPVNSEGGGKSDEDNGGRNEDSDTREGQEVSVRTSTSNGGEACVKTTLPKSVDGSQNLKISTTSKHSVKRKPSSDTSNGYKSDDEESRSPMNSSSHLADTSVKSEPGQDADMAQSVNSKSSYEQESIGRPRSKKKKLDDIKREERNAREKERSYRITSQINELRNLLSTGGVIVPKGTKNAVLTEAANYIRVLQQQQYKSEIHRQQLIQQMQMIGGGQLGQQAASAIRHVAAQNGVWSLGNFGGVPPRSAMSSAISNVSDSVPNTVGQTTNVSNVSSDQSNTGCSGNETNQLLKDIEDHDYRFVFNSCGVGMAIASMGGAFIDCNQLFIELSEYTKQEICGLTIFNLTAREDLQNAFDLISQMISPPIDRSEATASCVLRGNMKNRTDLGLQITLIKDEGGIAKCFCVTLIRNPSSPFDTSEPVFANVEYIRKNTQKEEEKKQSNIASPAFMTG